MKKLLLYTALLSLLASCVKELPFPERSFEKKIVLNSFVSVGKPIQVYVSETYPTSAQGSPPPLTTATVRLLDSAKNLIETLYFDPVSQYYTASTVAQANTLYHIEAEETSASYFCSAQDRTPSAAPSLVINDTSRIFFQGNPNFFQFDVILSDVPLEENYYLFYCTRTYYEYKYNNGILTDSILKTEKTDLQTNDFWFVRNNNVQYSRKELVLVDKGFEGLVAFLKFGIFLPPVRTPQERTISVTLHTSSLSSDRFVYTSSLNEHLFYQSDPFSQTTSVFSNIQGGYGIFAADYTNSIEIGVE